MSQEALDGSDRDILINQGVTAGMTQRMRMNFEQAEPCCFCNYADHSPHTGSAESRALLTTEKIRMLELHPLADFEPGTNRPEVRFIERVNAWVRTRTRAAFLVPHIECVGAQVDIG